MFVRNCCYMPGWRRDFTRDELKTVTMLNEQIVIYRKNDGGLSRPVVTRLERSVRIQNWLAAEPSKMTVSARGERTCYFFAYGPWRQESELMESFYQLGLKAFKEDRTMIEAQQRNIKLSSNAAMLTTASDSAVSQFRRMMDKLMKDEAQAGATGPLSHAAEARV
jgi:phenylpropionate dioxygenase-like ring-hydroxylating dioxygenase large terminal subunit